MGQKSVEVNVVRTKLREVTAVLLVRAVAALAPLSPTALSLNRRLATAFFDGPAWRWDSV